jgi:hypothetical protein
MTDNSKPWGTLPKEFSKKSENESDLSKIQKSLNDITKKLDEQKKDLNDSKNKDYEFQGRLAKESLWSAFSIAIGSAFLSVGIAISFGIFEIINNAILAQQANWKFIAAYQNMGFLMTVGGLILIVIGVWGSHNRISKYVKQITKTDESKLNLDPGVPNFQKNRIYSNWRIHLALGIIIMFIGGILFIIPILNDRPEVQRWEGFGITRQHNMTLSSLQFNIVTIEEKQALHIYYATDDINGENPFLMFFIPYSGKLVNPDGNEFSLPGKWQTYTDHDLKTTILYKFFDCTDKKVCSDQYNLYFDFQEEVDAKQYYLHSINVPFLSPHHPEIIDAKNKILNKIPIYQIVEGWGMKNNATPVFRVTVLDDSTEYNAIPSGYIQPHVYNRTGVTNSVYVWDVPNYQIAFHLDYVDPNERYYYDNLRMISVVLFGTGTAFLVISCSELIYTRKIS